MSNRITYTVKEYDRLVSETGARFISDAPNNVTKLSDSDFDDLVEYLLSSVKEEGKQLFKIIKLSSHSHYGKTIQLQNYVGIIELPKSKNRIEVLPKIYSGNADDFDKKQLKMLLLSMLSTLKDFPVLELGNASLDIKELSLYEVFVRIFLGRVLELAKKGLRSDYLEVTENLNCYKGRLEMPMHIKYNAAHSERFYVRHDEYSLSRPENRILKLAIKKLLSNTEDAENAFLAKRTLIYFDEVEESVDYESDYRRISFDSSNQGYLGVIQWAMVFLRNKSFSIFGGDTNGQALLFPMDKLFEQYVASQVAKLINAHNKKYRTHYRFVSQKSTEFLFDIPKSFKLCPDIKVDGNQSVLLDTKWKILTDKKPKNNISEADMYQMYAYSKRYNASLVYLLYPQSPWSHLITNTEYEASRDPLKTHISLHFLNLKNMYDHSKKNYLADDNDLYSLLLQFLSKEAGAGFSITTV